MCQKSNFIVILICVGFLTALSGCGPKHSATASVGGRVTYQGKPVVTGQIMFLPEHGRPAVGSIGPDGSYTLTTFEPGDGALLGRCRVTIDARRVIGELAPEGTEDAGGIYVPPRVEQLVPEKYSRPETSALTVEVKPGENVFDFDLH